MSSAKVRQAQDDLHQLIVTIVVSPADRVPLHSLGKAGVHCGALLCNARVETDCGAPCRCSTLSGTTSASGEPSTSAEDVLILTWCMEQLETELEFAAACLCVASSLITLQVSIRIRLRCPFRRLSNDR